MHMRKIERCNMMVSEIGLGCEGDVYKRQVLKILNEDCYETLDEPEMKLIIRESVKTSKSE